jgi:hypothetical protein
MLQGSDGERQLQNLIFEIQKKTKTNLETGELGVQLL